MRVLLCLLLLPSALVAQRRGEGLPLDRVALGTTLRITSSGVVTVGRFQGFEEQRITLSDLSRCYGTACPGVAAIGVDVIDRADYAAGSRFLRGALLGTAIGTGLGAGLGALFVENSREDPNLKLVAAVLYGALGAAGGLLTGAIIGATQTRWKPIVLPDPTGSRLRMGLTLQVSR